MGQLRLMALQQSNISGGQSVSYTHLTLPTKRIVENLGVAVMLKKKILLSNHALRPGVILHYVGEDNKNTHK